MENRLTHFAIYADDIERAEKFYSAIFSWGFRGYGQADFKQITATKSTDDAPIGAIQSRNFSPVSEKVLGLECSITVDDVDETAKKIQQSGGTIVMAKTAIPHVGWLIKFLDTEGNLLCAIEYDSDAR